ncbi:phage head closure protein [Candidatus Accumulibacter sp. ACC007]|uniref:phage head closure protein n=1 Tax=Candidatus Accumulibacter sp. ACC007 TaxID=2823333 RepID=UPI0025B974FE|nr:phage head closure protein [Candidatus Accumulibacter sp. ACC007]
MHKTPLEAGRLKHRIVIEAPTRTQNPATGEVTTTWSPVATVFASIEPLSVKDFIAANTQKSKLSTRIVIRYRSGLNTSMRLVGPDGTIYTPAGFLADAGTGREYLTVPCATTN